MTDQHRPATISVEAAGQLLGISRSAAYRAANAGTLPALRVGRRLLVPTAKLHRLLGLPTDLAAPDGNGDAAGHASNGGSATNGHGSGPGGGGPR